MTMNFWIRSSSKCLQLGLLRQRNIYAHIKNKYINTTHTMQRSASSIPHHIHRVEVNQESVQTPGETIDFELSVIDTHPGDKDRPVVFAIHGAPGWAGDFEPLIQMLSDRGVRFVGPTFPGFETSEVESSKLYHLDYTTDGRASIVRQILRHVGIDRISVLMCHSAGGWLGYKLAAECDLVQSVCLLNPGGARPHKSLRPQFVIHAMAWLLLQKNLHFFLLPPLEAAYAQIGFSGVKAGEHLMVVQQIVSKQNFQHTRQHAAMIRQKQLPLLFAYTLNDKIIEAPVSEEMLFHHLCVDKDAVTKVDSARNQTPFSGTPVDPAQRQNPSRYAQGLQFERGGHIVYKANSEIILDQLLQLLAHVEGKQPSL